MRRFLALILLAMLPLELALGATPQPAKPIAARASSERADNPASKAIDGDSSDRSRWVSATAATPHWLELGFPEPLDLAGLHLFSGYAKQKPLRDFVVQFWRDGTWVDIPSANVKGNKLPRLAVRFDDTLAVRTDRLRLFVTGTEDGVARVGEVVVWPMSKAGVPQLLGDDQKPPVLVFLNQSGFNADAPKRFTAPLAEDGERFEVVPATGGAAVYSGVIKAKIGDFSDFEPRSSQEYVVKVGDQLSVPFRVADWLLERTTYQRAVDFMIDSRHYVGNDRNVCLGSYGWRDDHHFGWELHTLVPQWLSNPSAYTRMPRQIVYEKPTNPKLWGRLDPPRDDAPDIIKLIHWGADVIVTQGTTHELLKSQLAYFLYAWPWLKDYLPEQNYQVVRDFTFAQWRNPKADHGYPYDESPEHDLLALKTKIGSTKGGYPPGFTIQPNLLMHEVALREKRSDAGDYLEAARRQAAWIVDQLDWENPLATKGQRMSEFITVTGLCHLLSDHPQAAPAGLRDKLRAWAEVAIRRSDNLWDFRKLGDAPDQWTPTGDRPTMWNEPGNVVGFPAIVFALLPHLDDVAQKTRLEQLAWSHFDAMFGRNPTGRHFSYDAPRELEGVEYGWYSFYVGGIGRLENARFVIDGSPKNQHFPFKPEMGNIGWTEGWIQHNTPFNLSLAYLARNSTSIEVKRTGDTLVVRLEAPLNFDPAQIETATVSVQSASGDRESLVLKEENADSRFFVGTIPIAAATPTPGDGVLQYAPNDQIEAGYGFGYFTRKSGIKL